MAFIFRILLLIVVGIAPPLSSSQASISTGTVPANDESVTAASVPAVPYIALFGGLGTRDNIDEILRCKGVRPLTPRASLVGLSYQHPLANWKKSLYLKAEVQIIQHFTIQTCQEVTLAPLMRIDNIANIPRFPLHVSIGNGVSALVGATPHLEKHQGGVSRVLNYFFLETATDFGQKEVFFRWHHRCHLFETIAPRGRGSNFFLLGLRISL